MSETSLNSHCTDNGELVIEPRFTGRTYVAVLRVLVRGESAFVDKVDLAKDGAREHFVRQVAGQLPGVDPGEVETQLLRLCDARSATLQTADELAAEGGQEPTVADALVQITFAEAKLCHDEDFNAYASIEVDDHAETWPVRSKGFRLWLRRRLREEQNKSAHSEAVSTAIEEIESKAYFDAPEADVFVRLGEHEDGIWLDLADENWRTVCVNASGWHLVEKTPPIRFIRSRGMLPLPAPERGGNVDDLRKFLNVSDDSDFVLLVGWLLACLRPRGPYPILCLYGEQGSAKSTACKMLRALVDPNSALLRGEPRDPRDLIITATNSWVLGYDNLSYVRPWLSDAFCRLSTGGGFATRELYTDREEVIFDAQRPLIMNGITDLANRSDLLDRTLAVTLSPIPETQRRDERTLWNSFHAARPKILGALLDAVAIGLADGGKTQLTRMPRMADFALWVAACEPGLGWPAGTFADAHAENRASANDTAIEASVVGEVLRTFMASRASWEGTATELLGELEKIADERTRHRKAWPGSARKLSGDLRRIAPNLRAKGVRVEFKKSGKRLISLGRNGSPMDGMEAPEPTHRPEAQLLF